MVGREVGVVDVVLLAAELPAAVDGGLRRGEVVVGLEQRRHDDRAAIDDRLQQGALVALRVSREQHRRGQDLDRGHDRGAARQRLDQDAGLDETGVAAAHGLGQRDAQPALGDHAGPELLVGLALLLELADAGEADLRLEILTDRVLEEALSSR